MLGQDLCSAAKSLFEVFKSDKEVDITDESAVSGYISTNKPDVIINCAAYTAVDAAETETELNNKINAIGPEVLGKCSARAGIGIIHISTDYVLNGCPPKPLTETAPVNPINAYGKAKALGEFNLIKANSKHWIVRTSWLYGFNGNNFVKAMLNLMRTRDKISVVSDQLGNPTWTCDLANALLKIAEAQNMSGIYNFSGSGTTSWCDFAKEIQKEALQRNLIKHEIPILPIPSSEWKSAAKRPMWSALNKTKIKETFGINISSWKSSLSKYMDLEK